MLFIDLSLAFNTIIPQQLINKLNLLGLNNSLCNWILDFLTGRPQSVRVGHNTSSTTTLSTGAPQGCVLSPDPWLHCQVQLQPHHQVRWWHNSGRSHQQQRWNALQRGSGTAGLMVWRYNLSLNVEKTKEVVVDFRRRNSIDHPSLTIDSSTVAKVSSTKFLGLHITEDLTWTTNTMSLLQEGTTAPTLSSAGWKSKSPSTHPHHILQGAPLRVCLTSCITVWYGNCSAADRKTLQRTVNNGCKDHRCPSPIHPGHFPCTMLQQNQQHHEGPRHTPPTVSSSSYHQEDGTGALEPAPPDCSTAFYPRPNYPAPLWNPHANPYPPETWDHLTPPPPPPLQTPPQPYHTKEKLWTFLFSVQFKCATHRWVGLYKPPVVTHSPLCALDTFHTLPCVHNPTKDSCTTNHLVLFPS